MKRILAALLLFPCLALAQAYPSRPVRIIVPYPPGGATDVMARVVAQKLSESWGQQALVDNKPGASGSIGSDLVAKSTADGYTLAAQTAATGLSTAHLAQAIADGIAAAVNGSVGLGTQIAAYKIWYQP